MATNAKTRIKALEVIAANIDRREESAEIGYADYKRLCAYADYDPKYNDSFGFELDGEAYHVNALTIERSKARGGNTTTYTLSRP